MRILAVNWLDSDNPLAGGAEVHFFEIFGRLVERGHEVVLVTSGWEGAASQATIAGIEVRRFGGRHSFALRGRGAVKGLLAEREFDIVVEDINKLPLVWDDRLQRSLDSGGERRLAGGTVDSAALQGSGVSRHQR